MPGQPTEVVLAQGGQLPLYNDSGLVNSVPNGDSAPSFDSIAFAGSPLTIYAEPFTSVQNPFFTVAQLTSSGLSYTPIAGTNYGPPLEREVSSAPMARCSIPTAARYGIRRRRPCWAPLR